jgi:hypothetical protein
VGGAFARKQESKPEKHGLHGLSKESHGLHGKQGIWALTRNPARAERKKIPSPCNPWLHF